MTTSLGTGTMELSMAISATMPMYPQRLTRPNQKTMS